MLNHVFSPIQIGDISIANRLVVPAMAMGFCKQDGTATDRFVAYYEAKAKGGWGLIITEDYAVDPGGIGYPNIAGLWDDKQIDSHEMLTNTVKQHGSKIFAQLYHAGRQTNSLLTGGSQPVAPSPIPCPVMKETPHELTMIEINELVNKFGDAALRAQKAGFDGIELHGAHGYLIAQFMSPYSNKRTDIYGGSLVNRMRFPLEIISNIRAKTGKKYPIIFRISSDEYVPDGLSLQDVKAIAILLEQAGVSAIHVSAGVYGSRFNIIPPAAVKHAWNSDSAAEIKKVVLLPVITVGRINDPLIAEAIISSDQADMVAMGRASLADPYLPYKAKRGKYNDIIYCIACLQGCWGKGPRGRCILNPLTGKELELSITPAQYRKKVFIAGAGPAGMQAAIIAARRGHEVHLFEKTNRLGGQYALAAQPPAKAEISSFLAWQEKQLNSLQVKLYLNSELTSEKVAEGKPDAVIIATGAEALIPDIPGCQQSNVFTAHEVLAGKCNMGRTVAIIGGGSIGAETAAYLAYQGRETMILEMSSAIAEDAEDAVKHYLIKYLMEKSVKIQLNTKVIAIQNNTLIVEADGEAREIGYIDTIVLATGVRSVNDLASELQGIIPQILTIGDALKVRKATEAIEEGYKAGLSI